MNNYNYICKEFKNNTMKTETEVRNSKDTTEEKVMAVLEYFLNQNDADEIYSAINDNQYEVKDIVELIERSINN